MMKLQLGVAAFARMVGTVISKVLDPRRFLARYHAKAFYLDTKRSLPWLQHPSNLTLASFMSDVPCDHYRYRALADPRQIRLLKVSYGEEPAQCMCELLPVSLDNMSTEYLAWSYTWGKPTITNAIMFTNNEVLYTTRSVHIILNTLFVRKKSIYVWIDSICINQNDAVEKSAQVLLMGEIYSKANQVLISLGVATPESDLGMDIIYPLRHAIDSAKRAGEDPTLMNARVILRRMLLNPRKPSFGAFQNLMKKPWFNRIWVIQEVAVASNPVIICGDRAVAWDDLVLVATVIDDLSLASILQIEAGETDVVSAAVGMSFLQTMNTARIVKQEQKEAKIQDLLVRMHDFDATDPRDKIFALLGLATDAADVMLNPDYEASVEEIYTKTALYLLRRDDSITILHKSGIGGPREYRDLPSWVPRWHTRPEDSEDILGGRHKAAEYRAAGNTTSIVNSPDGRVLVIDGIITDTINGISSQLKFQPGATPSTASESPISPEMEEIENLVRAVKSRSEISSTTYPGNNNHNWTEATWRTLLTNTFLGAPASAEYGESYTLFKQIISRDPAEGRISFSPELLQKIVLFTSQFFVTAQNKKFFITEKGYIGLTSPGTLVGDKVCIFLGGHTPFVIRKVISDTLEEEDDWPSWSLVGEAYVHGLMNGEGLRMGDVESIKLT